MSAATDGRPGRSRREQQRRVGCRFTASQNSECRAAKASRALPRAGVGGRLEKVACRRGCPANSPPALRVVKAPSSSWRATPNGNRVQLADARPRVVSELGGPRAPSTAAGSCRPRRPFDQPAASAATASPRAYRQRTSWSRSTSPSRCRAARWRDRARGRGRWLGRRLVVRSSARGGHHPALGASDSSRSTPAGPRHASASPLPPLEPLHHAHETTRGRRC